MAYQSSTLYLSCVWMRGPIKDVNIVPAIKPILVLQNVLDKIPVYTLY